MNDSPAGIRKRAMKLLRECWKPILITSAIILALSIASVCLTQLVPVIPDEHGIITRQSTLLRRFVDLLLSFVTDTACQPILMLGLFTVLLHHLRGNGCTASTYLHGLKRWRTAIWLDILIGLRMLGYLLAGLLGMMILSLIPILGSLLGSIGFIVLVYWLELRYSLAPLHLADDGDERLLNASDCIQYALQDAAAFTISGLFHVLWPSFLITIVASILGKLLPGSLPITCARIVMSYVAKALMVACLTAVFQHLRDSKPQDEAPSEGLLRARTLVAESSDAQQHE